MYTKTKWLILLCMIGAVFTHVSAKEVLSYDTIDAHCERDGLAVLSCSEEREPLFQDVVEKTTLYINESLLTSGAVPTSYAPLRMVASHVMYLQYTIEQRIPSFERTEKEQFQLETVHLVTHKYVAKSLAGLDSLTHIQKGWTGVSYQELKIPPLSGRDDETKKEEGLKAAECYEANKNSDGSFNEKTLGACLAALKKASQKTKEQACAGDDGYHAVSLEASMKNRYVSVDHYLKKDGKLYYALQADINTPLDCLSDSFHSYVYEYDCATQTPKQIAKNPYEEELPQCGIQLRGKNENRLLISFIPFERAGQWLDSYAWLDTKKGKVDWLGLTPLAYQITKAQDGFAGYERWRASLMNHIAGNLLPRERALPVETLGVIALKDLSEDASTATLRHIYLSPDLPPGTGASYFVTETNLDLINKKFIGATE